jgi:4-hydroxythreonine-4-phosphate dehydrogenase
MTVNKPVIITMGDPNGVGPEILLSYAQVVTDFSRIAVVGDLSVLELCRKKLGFKHSIHVMGSMTDLSGDKLNLWDMKLLGSQDITPGEESEIAGKAAREYIVEAANLCLSGKAEGMVTLPVNKGAIRMSDPDFTGHTELIAQICGVEDYTMMLYSEKLAVSHVSTHCSLLTAIKSLNGERVKTVVRLTDQALTRSGKSPRIAVAGLNPHAGEGGAFGREEIDILSPAIIELQQEGINVTGPEPPDTVFHNTLKGRFDGVVALYHDQGHIAMKTLDFDGGVNVTLGLPFMRSSVDHGTAYDIAWQGKASIKSFSLAMDFCQKSDKQKN